MHAAASQASAAGWRRRVTAAPITYRSLAALLLVSFAIASVQGACGAELLADVHAQRVAQFALGVGKLAERPRDELAAALLVGEGERDQLDIGEPGDPQVRSTGHQPLGGGGVEVAAPEAVDPRAGGRQLDIGPLDFCAKAAG